MVRFLIQRPVAVIMTTIALLIFGIISFIQLPVSLLPEIEVPSIVIKINYLNGSPGVQQRNRP